MSDEHVLDDDHADAIANQVSEDLDEPPAHGRRVLLEHLSETFPFGVYCAMLSAAAPDVDTSVDEHARVPVLELAQPMPWGAVVRIRVPVTEITALLEEAETPLTTAHAASEAFAPPREVKS